MSAFVFGCGPIGARGDAGRDESVAALRAAWDGGIRHFDTAPSYGDGAAERLLGDALRELPRDEVTVSTTVGRVQMAVLDPYAAGSGPRREPAFDFSGDAVRSSLAGSLSRLGMNRVDTVFVHD